MQKIMVLGAVLLFCSLQSCYYDNEEELYPKPPGCDTANITYNGFVKPLMAQRCAIAGCHNSLSGPSIGAVLETHADFKDYLDKPGKKQFFMDCIRQIPGSKPMPQGGGAKLDGCQIQRLQTWINAGYPNN